MEYSPYFCTLIRKLSISCCPEGKEQDGVSCGTCVSLTLVHKEDMRGHRAPEFNSSPEEFNWFYQFVGRVGGQGKINEWKAARKNLDQFIY